MAGNLTEVLTEIFTGLAASILALVTARDELRRRLGGPGLPVLRETLDMVTAYLEAEQLRGRISPTIPVRTQALTLVSTAHLLFAGHDPAPHEVHHAIEAALHTCP